MKSLEKTIQIRKRILKEFTVFAREQNVEIEPKVDVHEMNIGYEVYVEHYGRRRLYVKYESETDFLIDGFTASSGEGSHLHSYMSIAISDQFLSFAELWLVRSEWLINGKNFLQIRKKIL